MATSIEMPRYAPGKDTSFEVRRYNEAWEAASRLSDAEYLRFHRLAQAYYMPLWQEA